MLTNHLKIAWRHLKKQRTFTAINVISLALGITSAFVILLYIQDEVSYDRLHQKGDRIVRMTSWFSPNAKISNHFARCSNAWQPWVDALLEEYPEIKNVARLTLRRGNVLELGENRFSEDYFFITDRESFDVFTIPLTAGDPGTALDNPYSVIITESMAQKYLDGDALGQTLNIIDGQGNKTPYKITGIMKDWPTNSHIHINFLASNAEQDLSRDWAYTYLLLGEDADYKQLEQKLPDFVQRHFGDEAAATSAFYLQKLTDIHLRSHLDRELKANGDMNTIYVLSLIAIFIIAITCINYVNLSTAQSVKRTREIGIRRTIGSTRGQLAAQFLTGSMLTTTIAALLAVFCIHVVLPGLNEITGKSLSFRVMDGEFLQYLGLAICMGFLSGIYPALAISRSRPVSSLKSNMTISGGAKSGGLSIKNILVTLQFCISAFLLICALVLKSQLDYIHEKPLGLNKERVISIGNDIPQTVRSQYQVLRNRLLQHPGITGVSASMQEPSYEIKDMGSSFVESIREGDDKAYLYILPVDEHFIDLMEIELLDGEEFPAPNVNYSAMTFLHNADFLKEINETPRSYIINETALKHIGFNSAREALGKQMDWHNVVLDLQRGPIIGVVRDFHFSTLHKEIKPFVLVYEPRFLGSVLVKLRPANMPATIEEVGRIWNEMFPEKPFEYNFLDDLFADLYATEQQLNSVTSRFTVVALLIGCLGLFGLLLHSTEQRTKEIGIHKVLGASLANVVDLLTRDYIKCILVANLIAWPVAFYATTKWLQNFAYRIDLTFWPFLFSVLMTLFIALLTVSWQTIRAARANPVAELKYE